MTIAAPPPVDGPRLLWWAWIPCVVGFGGAGICLVVALIAASKDPEAVWPWYLLVVATGFPLVAAIGLPRPVSTGPLLAVLGVAVLWIYGAGIAIDVIDDDVAGLAPEAISVFGVVVVSFFGVLFLPREGSAGGLADAAMRHAFGASFILGYFALASIAIFHEDWNPSDLGESLATQVTTLFGVVVAFYFASAGTVEYLKHRENQQTIRSGRNPQTGEVVEAGAGPDPPPPGGGG